MREQAKQNVPGKGTGFGLDSGETRPYAPPMPDPVHQDAPRSIGAILRQIGPGLILTASIVGSGEVIATPKLAAEAASRSKGSGNASPRTPAP